MSHTVRNITMMADQEIEIMGKPVNIHDIVSIIVNSEGKIIEVCTKKGGWI